MGSWLNADGLYLKFGTDKATASKGGEYVTTGALREIEIKLDLTTLTDTAAIVSDNIFFPKMRIEEVEIVTHTLATSGGAATLDIGLIRTDRTTEIDYEAFANGVAITTHDAAGEKTVLRIGSTGVGQLVGTTTTNPGYLTANYNTAAYTAGVIYVRIRYYAA
jgi:hypothetical protein